MPWDLKQGDAHVMQGLEKGSFEFVYSSHCLEHLEEPHTALIRWFELVKKGGYLIVCVPHRDLYEKKKRLPSLWNQDHKSFWLPEFNDPPHTWGLKWLFDTYIGADKYLLVENRICDEGWYQVPVEQHSPGEYQVELIAKKL